MVPMPRRSRWSLGAVLALAACTGSRTLIVDVRTDLVAGVEFTAVRTEVVDEAGGGATLGARDRAAFASEDWFGGQRVAELSDIAPEEYAVRVTLLRPDGATTASRLVRVRATASYALTVVITRDCAGVTCPSAGDDPAATTCFGGRCVDPRCGSPDAPDSCPSAECTLDGHCPDAPVACASPRCVEAVCLYMQNDACAAGEYCDLELGCRPLPSTTDGGRDAGADGGTDGGTGCVEGATCDPGEPCAVGRVVCEDGTPRCAVDGPAPADTVCRAAAGPCDVEERCGGATSCPPDDLAAAGVECRASAGECDAAEACTGASADCPADGPRADGTVCGTGGVCSSGSCVPCETGLPCATGRECERGTIDCSGGTPVCQSGGAAAAGTLCRAASGPCDREETCDGSGLDCPADGFFGASTVCRPAASGGCDVAEVCGGSGAACPPDVFAGTSTTCRPAAGSCDVAETCSGTSASCGSDLRRGAGFVCRGVAGDCDVAEVCDGSSVSCPSDAAAAGGTVCRPAAGPCDVAESCNGTSTSCPADAFVSAGTQCRTGSGVCNPAEACTGAGPSCPVDAIAAEGTLCGTETCGPYGACTGTGCDLTMGMQSASCSTPACSAGTCSGSSGRTDTRSCTRSASCPDACCNASELGDTCSSDCGPFPVGVTTTGTAYTTVVGNPFGTSFEDHCPGDSVVGQLSLDYQAEHMRGMWTNCQDVTFVADRTGTPRYRVALGTYRTLPERGGDGWTTWDCPGDQVVTGFRAGTTTYSGRTVVDAIELRCSQMDAVGRTMPGVTFTYTFAGTELADDPFPPSATLSGPYDCPAGMVARGFRGSYSGSRTAPGALESFGLVCMSVVAR